MDKTYKISRVTENIGGGSITIDSSLSTISTNPVQNKVITNELNKKQNKLIAGANITIDGDTISASGGSGSGLILGESSGTAYEGSKGKANADNIKLLQDNVNHISTVDIADINLSLNNININKQDKLTPGDNITIIDNVISSTSETISPEQLEQIELNRKQINTNKNDIYSLKSAKQDKLYAGNGIKFSGNEISTNVKYFDTMPNPSTLSAGDIVLVPIETVSDLLTKEY